jgi:malonate-semialdehyde dehydrogenase (acetylating) / methylmalonate-semialdehyde dehydrogenase
MSHPISRRIEDRVTLRSHQTVCTIRAGDWALSVRADSQTRHAQVRGLLLQSSGVGDDQLCGGHQSEHLEVGNVAAAAELRVGPGGAEGTDVCPLVAPEARDRIEAALEALAEGEVLLDGRGDPGPAGTMIGPSIVEVSDPESELAREELFGPLLALVRVPDLDSALEFVNGSRYGNAGSIFTSSGAAARTYRYDAEAGMLGVNVGVAAPVAWFPFSGWKDSLDGDLHANGRDAVEFYTRKKVLTSRW